MNGRAWLVIVAALIGLLACGCGPAGSAGVDGPPPMVVERAEVLLRTPHASGNSSFEAAVAVSPDGRLVAASRLDWTPDGVAPESRGPVAAVLDAATGREVATIRDTIASEYCPVAFSPDGRTLAVGTFGSIRLCDPATGELRSKLEDGSVACGATALSFSPDGRRLAIASDFASLIVWDLASGRPSEPVNIHSREADSVAFAPDGRTVVAAGPGAVRCRSEFSLLGGWSVACGPGPGVARLFDPDSGAMRAVLTHGGRARSAAFAPDGRSLATAGGELKVWDLATNEARTLYDPQRGQMPASAVAFAPGGETLAVGLGGRDFRGPADVVRLHDAVSGRCRAVLRWDLGPVRSVAFGPDGRWLVAAGPAGVARWDLDPPGAAEDGRDP